jgi:hypothetical protein
MDRKCRNSALFDWIKTLLSPIFQIWQSVLIWFILKTNHFGISKNEEEIGSGPQTF